jgi:hypothetical protein
MPSNFLDEVQNDEEIIGLLDMLAQEIIEQAKRNIQKRNVITYPSYNVTIKGKIKTVPSQMRRQTRVASGKLLNSLTYYIVRYSSGPRIFFRGGSEVNAYWDVIERGRRPNKRTPPSSAIEKWMVIRGIRPKRKVKNLDKWRKGMAWVIAQHIGAKGIKGIEYFQKATNSVMSTYGVEIDTRFAKVLSVRVTDYLQQQINAPIQ